MTENDFSVVGMCGDYTLFACCDFQYMMKFGAALSNSIWHNTTNSFHLHVINPDGYVDQLEHMNNEGEGRITFSWERMVLPSKAELASQRFVRAVNILEHTDRVLIIDADAIVRKQVEDFEQFDWGLFLREPLPGTVGYERYATHVAAGAVYLSRNAMPVAEYLHDRLKDSVGKAWFNDQAVLYDAYKKFQFDFDFVRMPPSLIDWEFNEDSAIWTGKGPRKYENERFVEAVKHYNGE